MAKNANPNDRPAGATQVRAPEPPKQPTMVGDATIEYLPTEPPDDGSATCDLPPPAPPEDGSATCDLPPSAPADDGSATCDLPPPAATPDDGSATCDLPPAAPTHSPAPVEFGTLDYQAPTEDFSGHVPTGETPGAATCDLDSSSASRQQATNVRPRADVTHPTAPDADATSTSPTRAGRYVFKKFHAKGGMGEVWLAEDSDLGRPVALKRILKGREHLAPQFVQEARVTGQLEHPGVIPVHELSEENDKPFYVMKFVQGQTLKAVIGDYHAGTTAGSPREVQWLRLLNIFLDLCQTMAYAHSRGVIHRDIKPDNVMIGAYGETLVLDWGLAKVVGEPESSDPLAAIQLSGGDTMASLAGTIKGTPTFFAPEVAAGKVSEVDQLSDVYLLGATLYNMITGKAPRTGTKLSEILELARNTPPVPPRQVDPTVPKPLDAICRKALAFKKEDRYQSAGALADDMQRYLAGEPVSAYQENTLERTWRWIKRHRTALGRTAAALVILTVAATAFVFIREAEGRRAAAQAQADQLQREEDARKQILAFRGRADEARFYAASANPVAEAIPGLDAGQAEIQAAAALKIADQWGPELEKMPLAAERAGLKKDLYDLLLEIAQLKSGQDAKQAHVLLTQAAQFHAPTRSYYRLLALCRQANGDKAQADADRARANEPATLTGAMDFYLLGEQSRVESLRQVKDNVKEEKEGKRAGIKALLARREALLEAVAFYRQALRQDPNHYWSHFQLGACYSGLGSYPEATEAFSTCVALRPKAPWGYSSRGLALSAIETRRTEAEADLDFAIKLAPDFAPARLHRAVFYAVQKRYKDAEAAFAAILPPADSKPMPQAFLARGQMYMERGMFTEAITDFETAAAAKRPIRAVYLHLTRCYLMEGREKEALASLGSFLQADMVDVKPFQLHERRARELRLIASEIPPEAKNRREGVYVLALTELDQAIKLGGDTASLFDELGAAQEKLAELQPKNALQRMKQAAAAYARAIEAAPKAHETLIKRGWLYANLNENEMARADFARAVKNAPLNAEAHTGLGYTEAVLKAPGPARIHANVALLHGGGDYLVLHNVACIFGTLTQTDAPRAKEYEDMAIAQLQRAVDLWKQGGKRGPDELHLIDIEPAFPPSLRKRQEFEDLKTR